MFVDPNALAYLVLSGFPLLALVVLATTRSPVSASSALLLSSVMFLPMRLKFNLPLLPPLGREEISHLSVLLGLALYHRRRLASARPGTGLELLCVPMMIGGWFTVWTNSDPLQYGPRIIPGMELSETPTACLSDLLTFAVPFFLGRALIRDTKELRVVLSLLASAGILYSLFIGIELRLSPQFHLWIYGYHPDSYASVARSWGDRPFVFMQNGLALGVFMAICLIAVVALARARLRSSAGFPGLSPALCVPYLALVLVFVKSVAATIWGIALSLVLLLAPRWAARLCMIFAVLVATYPALRIADLVPTQAMVRFFEFTGRGSSLEDRFETEDLCLEKSRERRMFGWGGYGRHWVHDQATGSAMTAPDGYWMIQFGGRGIVGFATSFALIVTPILQACWRVGRLRDRRDQTLLLGLALVVLCQALDLLPNGLFTNYGVFLAGGLSGVASELAPRRRGAAAAARARSRE